MSLFGALAEAEREGKEVQVASGSLDASGQLVIETPFAAIDHVEASLSEQATAPSTSVITSATGGNTVTLYGWMPTAAADTTLVASTGQESVTAVIIGRRR